MTWTMYRSWFKKKCNNPWPLAKVWHHWGHLIHLLILFFWTAVFVMSSFRQHATITQQKKQLFSPQKEVHFSELSYHGWVHQPIMMCVTATDSKTTLSVAASLCYAPTSLMSRSWVAAVYLTRNTQRHERCFLSCYPTSRLSASTLGDDYETFPVVISVPTMGGTQSHLVESMSVIIVSSSLLDVPSFIQDSTDSHSTKPAWNRTKNFK